MKVYLKTVFLLCCCAFAVMLRAQTGAADTSNTAIAIQNAVSAYHQFVSPPTNLYNGSEYVDYAYTLKEGIPFFETGQFSNGSVEYDNVLYENIPVLYDEVLGEVIVQDFYNRGKIKLNTEKVTGFSLLNHHFVKLLPDSIGKSAMRPGFYDVLYQGSTGVYKRQTKKILETITVSMGLNRKIDEQNEYFIKKGNVYYAVSNKKSVLNITKDKKKEMQQYIKKNRLNVRTTKEIALIKIATYYDQLTNK